MSNLSQCKWEMCPKHNECRRFTELASPNQVYMNFQNICKESNDFRWQWKIVVDEFVNKEEITDNK